MGIFGKKKEEIKDEVVKSEKTTAEVKVAKVAPVVKAKPAVKAGAKRGGTTQAYKILIRPMITEKATELGALNKYVFVIDPKMNKVEVKKAIRSVYNVEPTRINISNIAGKNVSYGRIRGQRKNWKKAIVTLKAGDKIEVYEGV